MDLDAWPYPAKPLVPLAETVHERYSVEIFRGCTRGCRFCQAGMITRPVRERSINTIGDMVENGIRKSGFEEVGLLSLSSADHTEIGEVATGLADRYEGTNVSLSPAVDPRRRLQHHPRQRVLPQRPPLGADLRARGRLGADAQGDQQGGHRGGPDPDRRHGVLPRLAAGEALLHVRPPDRDRRGRPRRSPTWRRRSSPRAARSRAATTSAARCRSVASCPSRTRRSSGPPSSTTRPPTSGCASCARTVRTDKRFGRAIGFRYHDGKPGIIEGLLSRGDRRVGRVIEQVWRDGGRFDGWSEHFSYDRWVECAETALAGTGVDVDWFTTRERDYDEVLPWDHLDSGLDKDWLWADWEDSLAAAADPDGVPTSRTAAGRPATTAACAPRWAPRSRSAPPARSCCPLSVV